MQTMATDHRVPLQQYTSGHVFELEQRLYGQDLNSPTAKPVSLVARRSTQLPEPDLFTSLLFHRESVYGTGQELAVRDATTIPDLSRGTSISKACRRSASLIEEQDSSLTDALRYPRDVHEEVDVLRPLGILQNFNTMAPKRTTRGQAVKKGTLTKPKENKDDGATKKRRAPALSSDRATKASKTQANSKRQVRAATVTQEYNKKPSSVEKELAGMQTRYEEQMQQLRQELEEAKAETEQVRILMEAERGKLDMIAKERDALGIACTTSKSQYDELVVAHRSLRDKYEQAQKDDESNRQEVLRRRKATSDQEEQARVLRSENKRLRKELEVVRLTAVSPRSSMVRTILSPAPSSPASMTDEGKRADNLRKIYVQVKRRFDNLHSVAVNLVTCTRSMDVNSFGEFGRYLRALKTALEEEGQGQNTRVFAEEDSAEGK